MTDEKKAISITESFLRESKVYKNYVVDSTKIMERESLWYVPFKELNPNSNEILVGAYNGLIVDKKSSEFMQPGSALDLEEWIYGFKIGLRGGRYDLLIDKINDYKGTLDILDKLRLKYVKMEIDDGTEWKIPKDFKRKDIEKRLDKLPCLFKNQLFTFSIDVFRQIRNEEVFEYNLLKSESADSKILGELIEE